MPDYNPHMLDKVRKTIQVHSLVQPGEGVLVAVSGGPDSVALLRIFELLRTAYNLDITVAHLNHGIRGADADREEAFVRLLAEKMKVRFISKRVHLDERRKGASLEEAAREERYRFLYDAAEECGAVRIATGHHRDDQVETFLIHLFRGAGLDGLKGMAPVRDNVLIRPLLYVSREEIIAFLHNEGLSWMTDDSNADQTFLRNNIRNWLVPELTKRYNPRISQNIAHAAEIIRLEDDYMNDVVHKLLLSWEVDPASPNEMILPLGAFYLQHRAVQARIVKFLLEAMTPFHNGIGSRHIESALALCHNNHSEYRTLDLPAGILVEKLAQTLIIRKHPDASVRGIARNEIVPFEIKAEAPAIIIVPGMEKKIRLEFVKRFDPVDIKAHPEAAYIDYDCIRGPLVVRNWRHGDRMDFLGMAGTKKLKKYFIDKKIPSWVRGTIPLLADSQSVVWIAAEKISRRVRITEKTKNVLKIELV